jgi:hypothetical protein
MHSTKRVYTVGKETTPLWVLKSAVSLDVSKTGLEQFQGCCFEMGLLRTLNSTLEKYAAYG